MDFFKKRDYITHMKKFIYSFLVLVMLTPSLACAMPTCADDASGIIKVEKPCADHLSKNTKADKSSDQVKLVLDCMGVDLQKADTASINAPDLKSFSVSYILTDDRFGAQNINQYTQEIRGPPPFTALTQTQPPILQSTQRVRL